MRTLQNRVCPSPSHSEGDPSKRSERSQGMPESPAIEPQPINPEQYSKVPPTRALRRTERPSRIHKNPVIPADAGASAHGTSNQNPQSTPCLAIPATTTVIPADAGASADGTSNQNQKSTPFLAIPATTTVIPTDAGASADGTSIQRGRANGEALAFQT